MLRRLPLCVSHYQSNEVFQLNLLNHYDVGPLVFPSLCKLRCVLTRKDVNYLFFKVRALDIDCIPIHLTTDGREIKGIQGEKND